LKNKNLNDDDIQSASIINKSGTDLLTLIDNILDLSKVEAGKMKILLKEININNFVNDIKDSLSRMAKEKELSFEIKIDDNAPKFIKTDPYKLKQILINLIINAIKFTEKGAISIFVNSTKDMNVDLLHSNLEEESTIEISVADSGIGISEEDQLLIFEPFQQVDGSLSKKLGGTGLGLSISYELSKFLGGELQVKSIIGEGSTFSLYLPINGEIVSNNQSSESLNNSNEKVYTKPGVNIEEDRKITNVFVKDDRDNIEFTDDVLLLIDDDPLFLKILIKQCHDKGFKCIATTTGEEGLKFVISTPSIKAIMLDIRLPGKEGWTILHELKDNSITRHIPVFVMSASEKLNEAYRIGAFGALYKPIRKSELDNVFSRISNFINRENKKLLIIGYDKKESKSIRELLTYDDLEIFEIFDSEEAIKLIKTTKIDCVIVNHKISDMLVSIFLDKMNAIIQENIPNVIVYSEQKISKVESTKFVKYPRTLLLTEKRLNEHLLDKTIIALHQVVKDLPDNMQCSIAKLYDIDSLFNNRTVMIVDDDMRNLFAATKILNEKGVKVIKAENGKRSLELLEEHEDIDLILMDMIMPDMDGYTVIKNIRDLKNNKIKNHSLPIIALTAKAMINDRKICIEAGASDYISKPYDMEVLFSVLRVWLYNR
jgi:CheY-like chemotaxis protein